MKLIVLINFKLSRIVGILTFKQHYKYSHWLFRALGTHTSVNSEIFARVLFSRNFAYAQFRENKVLAKWRNHSVNY